MSYDTSNYSSLGRRRLASYSSSSGSSRSSFSSDYGSSSTHGFSPGFSSLGSTTSLSTLGLSGSVYSSRPPLSSSFSTRSREEPFLSTSMMKRDTIINSLVRNSHELTRHDFLPADAASRSSSIIHRSYRSAIDRSRTKTSELPVSSLTARSSSDFSSFSSFATTSSYETTYRPSYRPILIQRPSFEFDNYTPRPREERQQDMHFKSIRRDRPLVKFREKEEVNPEKFRELLDSWTPETIEEHEDEDYETRKRDSVRSNDSGIGSFRNSFGKRSRKKSGEFLSSDLSPTIDEKDSGTEDNEDLSSERRFGRYSSVDHITSVDEGVHMEAEYESRSPRDVVSPLGFQDTISSRPLSRNDVPNAFEKQEYVHSLRVDDHPLTNSETLSTLVQTDEQHPETKPTAPQRVRRRSDLETLENTSSDASLANTNRTLTNRRRELKPHSNVTEGEHTKIAEVGEVETSKDVEDFVCKTEKMDKTTLLSREPNAEKTVKAKRFETSLNETETKTEITSADTSSITGHSQIPPSDRKLATDNKTESTKPHDADVKLTPKETDEKILKKSKLKKEDESKKTEVPNKSLPSQNETNHSETGCKIKDKLNKSTGKTTTESLIKTADSNKAELSSKQPIELPSKTVIGKPWKMPVETLNKNVLEKPGRISVEQSGKMTVESPGKNAVGSPNKALVGPFKKMKTEPLSKTKTEVQKENTTESTTKIAAESSSKATTESSRKTTAESSQKSKIKTLRTEKLDEIPVDKITEVLSNKKQIEPPAKSGVETSNSSAPIGSPNRTKMESPSKLKTEVPNENIPEAFRKSSVGPYSKVTVESPSKIIEENQQLSKTATDSPSKTKVESLSKTAVDSPSKMKVESLSKTPVDSISKTKFESLSKTVVDSPRKTKAELLSTTPTDSHSKTKEVSFSKSKADTLNKTIAESLSKPAADSPSKTKAESLSKTAVDSVSKTKVASLSKTVVDSPSKTKSELLSETLADSSTKRKAESFSKEAVVSPDKTKIKSPPKLTPDVPTESRDSTSETRIKPAVLGKSGKVDLRNIVNDEKPKNEQGNSKDGSKLTKTVGEITGAIPKTKRENFDKNKRNAVLLGDILPTNKNEKQLKGSESLGSSLSDNKTDKNIPSKNEIAELNISDEKIARGCSDTQRINSKATDITTPSRDVSSKENTSLRDTDGKDKFNIDRLKTKANTEKSDLPSEQKVLQEETNKKLPPESKNKKPSSEKDITNLENDVSLHKTEKGVPENLKKSPETTDSKRDMKTQQIDTSVSNKDPEITTQEVLSLSEKPLSSEATREESVNGLKNNVNSASEFEKKQQDAKFCKTDSSEKTSVIEETPISDGSFDTKENIDSQKYKIMIGKDISVPEPKGVSCVEEKSDDLLSEKSTPISDGSFDLKENIDSQKYKIMTDKDILLPENECVSGEEEKSKDQLPEISTESTYHRDDKTEILDSIPVTVEISDTKSQTECKHAPFVVKKSHSEDFTHHNSNTPGQVPENWKLQKSSSADTRAPKHTEPPLSVKTVIPPDFLVPHKQPRISDDHSLEKNSELHPLEKSSIEEKLGFNFDPNESSKLYDLKKSSTTGKIDFKAESPKLHDLKKSNTTECNDLVKRPPVTDGKSSQLNQDNSAQNSVKLDDQISLYSKCCEIEKEVLQPKETQTSVGNIPGESKETSAVISAILSTTEDKDSSVQTTDVSEAIPGENKETSVISAKLSTTEDKDSSVQTADVCESIPGESEEISTVTSAKLSTTEDKDKSIQTADDCEVIPGESKETVDVVSSKLLTTEDKDRSFQTADVCEVIPEENKETSAVTSAKLSTTEDRDRSVSTADICEAIPGESKETSAITSATLSTTEDKDKSIQTADTCEVIPEESKEAADVISSKLSAAKDKDSPIQTADACEVISEGSTETSAVISAKRSTTEDKDRSIPTAGVCEATEDKDRSIPTADDFEAIPGETSAVTSAKLSTTEDNDRSIQTADVCEIIPGESNETADAIPAKSSTTEDKNRSVQTAEVCEAAPENEIKAKTFRSEIEADSTAQKIASESQRKETREDKTIACPEIPAEVVRKKEQMSKEDNYAISKRNEANIPTPTDARPCVPKKLSKTDKSESSTPMNRLKPSPSALNIAIENVRAKIAKRTEQENLDRSSLEKILQKYTQKTKKDVLSPVVNVKDSSKTSQLSDKGIKTDSTPKTELKTVLTEQRDNDKASETISNTQPPKKDAEGTVAMDSKVAAEESKPKVKKPKKPKAEGEEKVKKKKKKKDKSEVTEEKVDTSAKNETAESPSKRNIASGENIASDGLTSSGVESVHSTQKTDLSAPSSGANNEASATTDTFSVNICNLTPPQSPAISDPEDVCDHLWSENKRSESSESFRQSRNSSVNSGTVRFRKYAVEDFHFLKVLGRGSYGKVMLAELKGNNQYFAVKCLKKDVVLEDNDVECTMIEKKVLAMGSSHPYLCTLFCTFQSQSHLFFVMEYLSGGDLMFHIQQSGRFDQERARFYAAEIVCALKYLHKRGIVYRDAKLDNICLDADGHVRLVDFGFCKLRIYRKECLPRNLCGTPDYMAPEIIKGHHYNQSVDWWSFGVLLYEMLIGQSPFNGTDEEELFWSVCNEEAYYPRFLSKEAKHILILLLEKNPEKRLGMPGCVAGDICYQPFFKHTNWEKVEKKEVRPPFRPKLKSETDVSNFDSDFTMEKAMLTPIDKQILDSMDQNQFDGFSYTNPRITD